MKIQLEDYPGGFPRDPSIIQRDLYYLSTIFFASKNMSDIRGTDTRNGSIASIFRNFEITEASRLLILVASISRHIIDCDHNLKSGNSISYNVVGTIEVKKNISDLSFRSACDKIIHGDSIGFEFDNLIKIGPREILTSGDILPIVYLYGRERNGERWDVAIKITDFIKVAFMILL